MKVSQKLFIEVALLFCFFNYVSLLPHEERVNTNMFHAKKYAEKPNYVKKVALDDIETSGQTNNIAENSFSWSNVMGMLMQMLFNNNELTAPSKSEDIDRNPTSPWANILSVGLRIVTALLGGNGNDGIDKVDNTSSGPMQNVLAAVFTAMFGGRDPEQVNAMAKQAGEFINIVVNLLDALKFSFSHRSLQSRSGKGLLESENDNSSLSSISLFLPYISSFNNLDSQECVKKNICEANWECISKMGSDSIFCQLGTITTSILLKQTTDMTIDTLYAAGRKGVDNRQCKLEYVNCNSVY